MNTVLFLFVATLGIAWLAYSNGANDNFKGVATLYGSGTTNYKTALTWATITSFAGCLVSLIAAQALVKTFSGKGLIAESLLGTPPLVIAVVGAAALTIYIATWIGMPTSTTHALTGSLVGVAVVTSLGSLPWSSLLQNFLTPLIASPILAIIVAVILYLAFHTFRLKTGISRNTCVCMEDGALQPVVCNEEGRMMVVANGIQVIVDDKENCVDAYQGKLVGIDAQKGIDSVHFLSGGAVCFSRAVNDTPKIAALMLVLPQTNSYWVLALVAVTMTLGGWLNSKRVAETMSKRITQLTPGQGLSANLSTAALVLFASNLGMPVSTTHVSCGSIFGIGLVNRQCQWKTVIEILSVWLTTFPFAAVVSAILYLVLV